jgi:hypothetical protein
MIRPYHIIIAGTIYAKRGEQWVITKGAGLGSDATPVRDGPLVAALDEVLRLHLLFDTSIPVGPTTSVGRG